VPLPPGSHLGRYEIGDPLGAGGMGEVYRARDTVLDRTVAVKLLPPGLAADPERLRRFAREARTAAALAHPGILVVHDVGEHEGCPYIVSELLAGESLRDRLWRGPLPRREAIDFAAQVATALAAAHEKGIVHRDLKPENLFIAPDGRARILDFGLAAIVSDDAGAGRSLAGASTATQLTDPHAVLGTLRYMAPEQARGEPADARSDLFALGAVLYEMLYGAPAFAGRSSADVTTAILRDEPPELSRSGRDADPVAALLRRCLAKQPEQRFQSARDLAFALEALARGGATRRPRRGLVAAAAIAAAVALALLAAQARRQGAAPKVAAPAVEAAPAAAGLAMPPAAAGAPSALAAARDAVVRGRHLWNKRDRASLEAAVREFQGAIDADPTFAPGYVGLADAFAALGYGNYLAPEDSFLRARAAAAQAVELDPGLAAAHASLGYAAMYFDWDFGQAAAELERALALDPRAPTAHQWRAYLLLMSGRPDEARAEIARARELDPLSPAIQTDMAFVAHYARRDEEAVRFAQAAFALSPDFPPAHFWLGRIYTGQRRFEAALAELEATGPLRSWQPTLAARGYLYGVWGREGDARAILAEFDRLRASGAYATSYGIALVHAGLGESDAAFAHLERAFAERSHWLVWLPFDPRFETLHADPRWPALLARLRPR
jgi:tetratricopeptide (TPR) repeat protein